MVPASTVTFRSRLFPRRGSGADRLPGVYQLDLEMSFVEQEDVWDAMEPMIGIFSDFAGASR